jgi:hypothetical protein
MKFFMVLHADPNSTAINGPSEEFMARMGEWVGQQMATGKVIATGAWEPAQQATVVGPVAGRAAIVDGPYTEAKELVGGFVLVEEETRAAAIAGATEFVQFHIDPWAGWNGWSEVREVFE